jgi:hypothetical protein
MVGKAFFAAVVIGVLSLATTAMIACEDGKSQEELEAEACADFVNLESSLKRWTPHCKESQQWER